jgi:putative peptide maturation system protein
MTLNDLFFWDISMKEAVEGTVIDTLNYLMTIVHDETRPEDARAGFRKLQQRYSEVGMHLVWEEEAYDRSVHYDALLNVPGNGTISISYCDDRAKPWPMRGVNRWTDAELVRVNNRALYVDQAIACLDFIWDETRITDRLVNVVLIQEELERNPIDVSDQELQTVMDAFRRARKLCKAEDANRWMERRGITHRELEQLISRQAVIVKLRDKITGHRVEEYFKAHSTDFDTVFIARFALGDQGSASALADGFRSGKLDFTAAAQACFIAARQSGRATADLFAAVQRHEAPEEIRTSLFDSAPGSILGPVREGEDYAIVRVLETVRAKLDHSTREAIKKILFDKWLEERRLTATVEWLWGNVKAGVRD